jgi:hypothetical protein
MTLLALPKTIFDRSLTLASAAKQARKDGDADGD